MQLRAFAKINLDLRVLGRRPDGYHEVRTILQTIDWADEILIEPADRFEFVAHGVEGGEGNLVVRAVRALEQAMGERVLARIELFKHIPIGAGLGGGSADAATVFLGLQLMLTPAWLKRHGQSGSEAGLDLASSLRRLGSDVPFFALGGRALGTGRGDEVAPLDDRTDYALAIVCPGIHIATVEAYSWLTVSHKASSIVGFRAESVPGSDEAESRNDFEGVVFARHPVLKEIRNELLKAGARRAALSGSGSAIFGIFGSEEEASRAAPRLSSFGAVRVTRPLSRQEYVQGMFWGVAKR